MGGVKSIEVTRLAEADPNEDVWFSIIIFKSKKHRDEVNARVNEEV
jgi:uncharacterized protein YbaA (DUF1428 family)